MANSEIYSKTHTSFPSGERTLILEPGAAMNRRYNIGTTWTEARLGVAMGLITASDPNTVPVAETLNYLNGPAFRFAVGVKDGSGILPEVAGSRFLGLRNPSTNITISTSASSIGVVRAVATNGTTVVFNAGSSIACNANAYVGLASSTAAYCFVLCVKIGITDRGLSTQTISVSASAPSTLIIPTEGNIRSTVAGATYSSLSTGVAWNSGGVALPIPDHVFIMFPFILNRVRVSAYLIEQYA